MKNNPRAQLHDAIEAYQQALDDMHHAEVVLAKARELHCKLVAKRADAFQNLDNEIAGGRAHLLKEALNNDADTSLVGQEPPGFAVAKIARDNLDEQIRGIADSLGVLQDEKEQAERHTQHCDYMLDMARENVFAHEAEQKAQEFVQKLMEVRRLSLQLRSMCVRQVRRDPSAHRLTGPFYGQGDSRRISMPPPVELAVHEECMGDYDRRGGLKLRDDIGRAVADWWARLRLDPLATLDTSEVLKVERLLPSDSATIVQAAK